MDATMIRLRNDQVLVGILTTVKEFSNDIRVAFSLRTFAKATFVRSKQETTSIVATTKEFDTRNPQIFSDINGAGSLQQAAIKENKGILLKTERNSK